jgi:tryptophanyl-tRNA synthetase
MALFENLEKRLAPLRARRQDLEAHKDDVMDILNEGAQKAKTVAGQTIEDVRQAMKI